MNRLKEKYNKEIVPSLKEQFSYFQDIAIEDEVSFENKKFFSEINWHTEDEVDYAKKIIPELEAKITELEDKIALAKILNRL